MGKDKSETIENIEKFILHVFGPHSDELAVFKELRSAELINRPSSIDNRNIKCSCGYSTCRIGLNFDQGSEPSQQYMLLTDKNGNEHNMHLNPENTKEIIAYLQSLKFE